MAAGRVPDGWKIPSKELLKELSASAAHAAYALSFLIANEQDSLIGDEQNSKKMPMPYHGVFVHARKVQAQRWLQIATEYVIATAAATPPQNLSLIHI